MALSDRDPNANAPSMMPPRCGKYSRSLAPAVLLRTPRFGPPVPVPGTYPLAKPGKYVVPTSRNFVTPRALTVSRGERPGKSAYLMKAKTKAPGCASGLLWARRWFALGEDSLDFAISHAATTTGWLPLKNVVEVVTSPEHGPGAFVVVSQPVPVHRTRLLLRAACRADRDSWVAAISKRIERERERENPAENILKTGEDDFVTSESKAKDEKEPWTNVEEFESDGEWALGVDSAGASYWTNRITGVSFWAGETQQNEAQPNSSDQVPTQREDNVSGDHREGKLGEEPAHASCQPWQPIDSAESAKVWDHGEGKLGEMPASVSYPPWQPAAVVEGDEYSERTEDDDCTEWSEQDYAEWSEDETR